MRPDETPQPSYVAATIGKDELMQLLGEVLKQVKPLHVQPLSEAARAAITLYDRNRDTLAHDHRLGTAVK